MDEADWLASDDPAVMLQYLAVNYLSRKLRLFAYGCVRLVWHLLEDERSRKAVEVAERYAGGEATQGQAVLTALEAKDAWHYGPAAEMAMWACAADCRNWLCPFLASAEDLPEPLSPAAQAALLRDIFGNPFRPLPPADEVDEWCLYRASSGTGPAGIARRIYRDRDWDALPVLADALEDAGCDNADILSHLRGPGPHVRGCFVLDAILGKE